MTIVYSQDFESTSVGSLPTGWADVTGTWAVTATNPVSGSHALAGGTADGNKIVCTASSALADMEVRYDCQYEDYFCGVYLRADSGLQNAYVMIPEYTNLSYFSLYKIVSGSATNLGQLGPTSGLGTVGAGAKFSVRARVKSSTIYFKIWPFGGTEPGSWSGSISDTSITAAGYFGFYNNSNTGGNATIDNVTLDDTIVGALTAGSSSSSGITATSATVINTGASGGTSPYSYQWYRSTTSGFTPGSGSIVSGATSLTLNDSGLSPSTTYYYVNVVTDSASATAASSQLAVTTSAPASLANGSLSASSVGSTTATVADSGASGGTSPYSYQWYRSTSSGFTPGGGNIVSGATSATLNDTGLTPSTTYYYKNIVTDHVGATATSSQLTVTTSAGSTGISVTNSALFWSPGNWDHLTSGTFGVSVDTMQATAAGAYLKFQVSGTVNLSLGIDNATNSGFPSGDMPTVRYSINGAAFTDVQLGPGQATLGLSSSLSTGSTYSVEVYFKASSSTNGYADVWGSSGVSPTNVLRINSIGLDSGGSVSAPTLRTKRSLHFGDSMTAGEHVNPDGSDDATQSWVPIMAQAFNAEYGQIAYGGQGWTVAGGSNAAAFMTAYNLYSVGRARSFSGLDYIFIHHGGNDARSSVSGSTIQSDCQTMLGNLRTACGSATIIFVVTPPQGSYNANLAAAVTAYKTATGDANAYAIDATALFPSTAFTLTFGTTTEWTYDGVHPLIFGHARLGAAYAALAKTATGGGSTSAGYSRSRLMNGG
jgi:hypothetical protein